jgi:hypothetical protein
MAPADTAPGHPRRLRPVGLKRAGSVKGLDATAGRAPYGLTRAGFSARENAPYGAVMDSAAAADGAGWGASGVLGQDRHDGVWVF